MDKIFGNLFILQPEDKKRQFLLSLSISEKRLVSNFLHERITNHLVLILERKSVRWNVNYDFWIKEYSSRINIEEFHVERNTELEKRFEEANNIPEFLSIISNTELLQLDLYLKQTKPVYFFDHDEEIGKMMEYLKMLAEV